MQIRLRIGSEEHKFDIGDVSNDKIKRAGEAVSKLLSEYADDRHPAKKTFKKAKK